MKIEIDESELNIREKLAHIDLMLADHDRIRAAMPLSQAMQQAQLAQAQADADRKRQEIRFAPWQLFISGAATGVGLLVAAAALLKLLA
jgi:cell pole-organizing protein PopZ